MKKTIFSLITPVICLITITISSCQTPNSCGPGMIYSAYANNGMGGCVPNTGGGNSTINQPDVLHYALPVSVTVSTTILYKSNGNISPRGTPFALCYGNATYSGNPYDVSTQYRDCTLKTIDGYLLEGIANQNLLNSTAFEADVSQLMAFLKNFAGNKSDLQMYKNKQIPVFVVGGNGTIKGTTSFDNQTGELAGDAVLYSVKDAVEWHTVGEIYGF